MRLGPEDEGRAAEVLLHPEVAPFLFDEGWAWPNSEAIADTLSDPRKFFLMPRPGMLLLARKLAHSIFEVHQAAIPEVRGPEVVRAGREAVRWLFENVPECHKLVGLTPTWNIHAIASASRVGFLIEGRLHKAAAWRGQMCDVAVLGLTREEALRWAE